LLFSLVVFVSTPGELYSTSELVLLVSCCSMTENFLVSGSVKSVSQWILVNTNTDLLISLTY
jgi:hypothetical protein